MSTIVKTRWREEDGVLTRMVGPFRQRMKHVMFKMSTGGRWVADMRCPTCGHTLNTRAGYDTPDREPRSKKFLLRHMDEWATIWPQEDTEMKSW